MTKWDNVTWYKAKVNTTTPAKFSRTSYFAPQRKPTHDWDLHEGEIFFLPGEANGAGWSHYLGIGVADRKGVVLPGEVSAQYLTPREYVSLCDNKWMLDAHDVENAGFDFRAFSKAFKYIYHNDEAFDIMRDLADNLWDKRFLKDEAIWNCVKSRNSYISGIKRKDFDYDEYDTETRRAGLSIDFHKRAAFINKQPFAVDQTKALLIVLATMISRTSAYDEGYMKLAAETAERYDVETIMGWVLRGADFEQMLPMLEHDIDYDLILAVS